MLYERIKSLCKEQGKTVKQLEEEAGIKAGCIHKWNEAMPMASSLVAVAKVLGTTAEALLEV